MIYIHVCSVNSTGHKHLINTFCNFSICQRLQIFPQPVGKNIQKILDVYGNLGTPHFTQASLNAQRTQVTTFKLHSQ
jgi:hypothetical protein